TDDSIQKRPGGSSLLNKIVSIFFSNTPFIDTSGTFETSIIEENDEKINGKTIKYGKPSYTEQNIVTNSLIMITHFGQTISKKVSKAPKLKLHRFFCQIDMNIVLNTKSNDEIPLYDDIKLYESSENICLEDIFKKGTYRFDDTDKNMQSHLIEENWKKITAIDIPINVNKLLKNNQSKCCDKPFWHNFRMPYGVKRVDEEKSIILYCCNRDNQTNMTSLEYNNNIIHFGKTPKFPTHFGSFLIVNKVMPMMGYDTNMDSMMNLKFTTGSAMQQLIDAVKEIINNSSNSEKPSEPEDTTDTNQTKDPLLSEGGIFN
ncbi:6302_t:CDS:2, partial [Cetraspora pellucida]